MTEGVAGTDRRVIRGHLDLIAGPVATTTNLQIELAWGPPEIGPCFARLFRLVELEEASDFAARVNEGGSNVYVGTTLKIPDADRHRRTSAQHASVATCMAIDIDSDLPASARLLPGRIKPRLLALSGRTPTLRGHLWIGLQVTSDLDLLDEVTGKLVSCCNGDMAARGRARVMRLAGTTSFPPKHKRQKGYCVEAVTAHFIDAPAYTLTELASALRQQSHGDVTGVRRFTGPGNTHRLATNDVRIVQSALDALPNTYAEQHDLWIRVGFALHAFDPSIRGLFLWRQFSERCPSKAALANFEYRWSTFGRRSSGRPLTLRWLFAEVRNYGLDPRVARRPFVKRR